jgi:Holliday junction resolvase RusA-like endonuclease
MIQFVISGRLSGTNDIIRLAAYNRYLGGAQRKREKDQCYAAIMAQNQSVRARFTKPVRVSMAWIEPNGRRDLDNISGGQKVILDALVMARVLPNDTREWLKGISHTFPPPDKSNPRIEVTVEEIA